MENYFLKKKKKKKNALTVSTEEDTLYTIYWIPKTLVILILLHMPDIFRC